jgi:phosphoribosylglycinamide formyltransferase-1
MKRNIAIFASGTGSNARKIIEHFKHHPDIGVGLVVCNNPTAGVLDIARGHHLPFLVVNRQEFKEGTGLSRALKQHHIDFIVLAGFLWLIPTWLVKQYEQRMVNIHPSLLPKFGGKGMYGMHVHEAVCQAGDRETGITIHYVNEQYDDGNIVFQTSCPVEPGDTPQSVAKKVQQLEHRYFPQVIEQLILNNIS